MTYDRLGRVRRRGQERGLRPLHPPLPERWRSRAVRVAMPECEWNRFEALVRRLGGSADTRARACGQTLSRLMDYAPQAGEEASAADWLDWERRKALRLLHAS